MFFVFTLILGKDFLLRVYLFSQNMFEMKVFDEY